MANKKIKHIVAKLLGETTEETLDIYDESALHATDIVDNLTSNDATKVLSAKQGKALNDSLAINTVTKHMTNSIPVSGDSAWRDSNHKIDFSSWKFVSIRVGVHSALTNSLIIPANVLAKHPDFYVSCIHNEDNLGFLRITNDGYVYTSARTKNYAFDFTIYSVT